MNKRLFALGMILAVGVGGGCGGDDKKGGGPVNPDGSTVPPVVDGDSGVVPGGNMDSGTVVTLPDGGMVFVPTPTGDGGPGPVTPGGDGGPGPIPNAPNMARLGAAGGSVQSADKRVTVNLPQDALRRPATLEVKPVAMAPAGALAGSVYEVTPAQEPIVENRYPRVVFNLSGFNAGGTAPADLVAALWDGTRWVSLGDTRPQGAQLPDNASSTIWNPKDQTLTAVLPRLGTVGLLGGLCELCTTTCDPATCTGTCEAYGMGCTKCVQACDGDKDGICRGGDDCNDNNPRINRNAVEICNDVDDDCDGYVDEGCNKCTSDAECGSLEYCNEAGTCDRCDNGCGTDCGVTGSNGGPGMCFRFGKAAACSRCVAPCDIDGDGFCPNGIPGGNQLRDCDDANATVRPERDENCANGLDDNCDGSINNGCKACTTDAECPGAGLTCIEGVCEACATTCNPATCAGTCKPYGKDGTCSRCSPPCDGDGDGACIQGSGSIPGGDCDDTNPAIHPRVGDEREPAEICGNNVDENCNLLRDEDCAACKSHAECPPGQMCNDGRCGSCRETCDPAMGCTVGREDPNPAQNDPGSLGVAGKCAPRGASCFACVPPCDLDGDGTCPASARPTIPADVIRREPYDDCDDMDPNVNKRAPEICGNMKDDNCNNLIDEECNTCAASAMCGTAEGCSNLK